MDFLEKKMDNITIIFAAFCFLYMKLFKLIFMVRFIKVLEGISSIEEIAT